MSATTALIFIAGIIIGWVVTVVIDAFHEPLPPLPRIVASDPLVTPMVLHITVMQNVDYDKFKTEYLRKYLNRVIYRMMPIDMPITAIQPTCRKLFDKLFEPMLNNLWSFWNPAYNELNLVAYYRHGDLQVDAYWTKPRVVEAS